MLTEVLGGRWTPELVHVRRAPPAEREMFERYFAVPVEFDSMFDGYSCPSESLDGPAFPVQTRMADNARRLLELLPTPNEQGLISESVRRAIALHLPTGDSNLDMDPSVVRRRIASEGSSFEAILLETRKDVATRFLTASSRPVDFIAAMTGCPSARAFSSWFETNFGQSPTAWRKDRREEAPAKAKDHSELIPM
jgi:AraC-like DNA-binding protein